MERSKRYLIAYFDHRINYVFDHESIRGPILQQLERRVGQLTNEVAESLLLGFDINSDRVDQFIKIFQARGAGERAFAYAFMQIAKPVIVARNSVAVKCGSKIPPFNPRIITHG